MQQDQIIAFRLHQNHLLKPLPVSKLAVAAGAGLQNTSPGAVALSLGIRTQGFKLNDLHEALLKKKSLVEITGIRGASYVVANSDFSLFTTAALPTQEKDLESFLGAAKGFLKSKKVAALDAVEEVSRVTARILNHKALTQDEIHEAWRKNLSKNLLRWCAGCKSFHVPYTLVMAVGLTGIFCFGPIKDGESQYVRADQWLPRSCIKTDLESTRRGLVEKFIRHYGPANPDGFATWAGVSKSAAKEFWSLIEDELIEVSAAAGSGPRKHWILKGDLKVFKSPPSAKGVLLLPPRDSFLNLPDRETLVDNKLIPKIWKILGNPGVILNDGAVVGIWRGQRKQTTMAYQFELFKKLSPPARKEAEEKAEMLAPLRECKDVEIKWG